MIVIFKLFYNTNAACQRPVGPFGPLLSKRMYVCMYAYVLACCSYIFVTRDCITL